MPPPISGTSFLVAGAVANGSLKVVLRKFVTRGPAVSVVYLPTRHLSARVRAFLDFLAAVVPEKPAWDNEVLGKA